MNSHEELSITLELLKQERQADLEQYKQKVMLLPLSRKTKEGKSWYPVRLVRHYIGTGERLIIEVERTQHLNQAHVFQSGKVVNVFCNARNTPGKEHEGGVINYVRDNTMVITLNSDELPDWIDDPLLGVDVMFDEMTYREMEFAMKEVMRAEGNRLAALREIILGYKMPGVSDERIAASDPIVSGLNESQKNALYNIRRSQDVAIVHGPPGTGKTTTLVEAIRISVKEEKQVLVTAPSNAAVDLLVDKLSEAGLKVLRIGHPARVTEQTLSKTLDARIANHEHYRDLRNMRKRMEQLRDMAFKYKREYGYSERQQRKLLLQEAKALKADADVLEFYIINDLLQNSEVIACTLVGSSHPTLRGKKYKTVFIDEAGQALEPACWIPIIRAERVVLAGDHHQLPPTVKSFEAGKAGLSKTLFGMLPVEFIDSAGCGFTEEQDPETLSRYNEEEARFLIRQVERLILHFGTDNWRYSIGIITPYSAQVERLIKLAEASEELSALASFITINTVDAFQGQERDVIAISLVRSNEKSEVGFLSDIRRTNVAITRAKKKLIMVGDSATLGAHPFYLELIEYMQQRGFYKSVYELDA